MTIRVLLADDHRMLRETLRAPLDARPEIEVIGEVGTGNDTLSSVELLCPDVVVLDIGLPDISGIEVARRISKLYPTVKVLALSGYADRYYVEEMLGAGAKGYIVKSAGSHELIEGVLAVARGDCYLSSEVTAVMVGHIQGGNKDAVPPPSVLANRERQVLRLIAEGKRSSEIAAVLGISVATAEVHRRNIKAKLGLHSAVDLTRYAIREGLAAT